VSPRAYQSHPIMCEVCGQERRAQLKGRAICRACLRKEPSARCVRCGYVKHDIDELSGLCPRCTSLMARPVAVCTRCSCSGAIYNQEQQLCKACTKYARQRARSKDRQVKVTCCVCGAMRSSVLLERAICSACWREERNGRGICSRCKRLKAYQVKAERLCKQCYKNQLAPRVLRSYVERYTTPYPYNMALFDLLTATIEWPAVTQKTDRKFRSFGHFLQIQPVSDPLTWETLEQVLPPLGPTNRTEPKQVRACLLELAHLLAAEGKLESWETYVARRNALSPINQAPEHIQALLHRYAIWLGERQSAPSNVREHLECLACFWQWCDRRGIHGPEEVHVSLVSDYLLTLYWLWQCSACEGTMPFEPRARTAPAVCSACGTIGSLAKQKRYAQNTVRSHRARLFVFFDWLKINRMVIANPVQRKTAAPEPTIRHYPPEVIKQLIAFITTTDADPIEAVMLYLIIFHALSVWELRHAALPTILPLRQDIAAPTLAEAYYVNVPKPAPTRGDRSPGRPDVRLDFPVKAAPWLKPLLLRFERQRQRMVGDAKNRYLFVTPKLARHNTVVSHCFIWKMVQQASLHVLGAACNPNALRKTAGVMFADRAGAGVLHWMGWDDQQAFAYTWASREVVHPRTQDSFEGTNHPLSPEPIIFPSPKESLRNATTKRATSTD
jgi:hypothetical protein